MPRGSGSASLRLSLASNRSSNRSSSNHSSSHLCLERGSRKSSTELCRRSERFEQASAPTTSSPWPLSPFFFFSPILTPTHSHVHHTTAPAQSRSSARALHSRIAEELCAREKPSSHPGALALSHECADFQSRDTPNARMPCPIYLNTRIADQSPDSALPTYLNTRTPAQSPDSASFFIFDLFGHDSHLAQGLFKTC